MWKKYIKIFEKQSVSMKDYFKYVQANFSDLLKLLNKNELVICINKPNDDLFYQTKNIDSFFYEGKFSELISIFYHYFYMDWNFLDIKKSTINESIDVLYKKEFFEFQKSSFANHISLDIERILSNDCNHLTFLIIFFMPCINKKEILFNYKKNRPLLSCNNITINSFYMIQELMKIYERDNYDFFCKNDNFNHQLIEDCTEKIQVFNENNIKWKKELPIKKIKFLLGENCSFTDFELLRKRKKKINYPYLFSFLIEFQSSINFIRLNKNLKLKLTNDNKIIKI